ncbi:predicted protein [Postia placenta Mad-698-R]|nr:predicted protein [Postia placenta Mad-698-R]
MILPFPAEIWLDIFHGLAKEGEYDTLERCRVVCKGLQLMAEECLLESMMFESTEGVERIKVDTSGEEMRRWGGPATVARLLVCALLRLEDLYLYNVRFTRQPFDPSTISQFRLLLRTQLKGLVLGESEVAAMPTHSFVELVDVIAAIGNRQCPVPPRGPTQACPVWSAIRALEITSYSFPSVAALACYLCALPSLETLKLHWSRTSLKHGFDRKSIPAHSSLPSRLEAVEVIFRDITCSGLLSMARTCPHIQTRVQVSLSWGEDWGLLMDGLPQLDAMLSLPVFGNLVKVAVFMKICGEQNDQWAQGVMKAMRKWNRTACCKLLSAAVGVIGSQFDNLMQAKSCKPICHTCATIWLHPRQNQIPTLNPHNFLQHLAQNIYKQWSSGACHLD